MKQDMMPLLNLPPYKAKIVEKNAKRVIFDPLRRKYVALTPEEWVRQNFIHYLMSEKDYPSNLIGNEITLQLNSTTKRCDSVVYDVFLNPLMIIEYKSPTVKVSKSVFDQICRYNMSLRAKYLTVSNGLKHYCCVIDYSDLSYKFLDSIPLYSEMVEKPG